MSLSARCFAIALAVANWCCEAHGPVRPTATGTAAAPAFFAPAAAQQPGSLRELPVADFQPALLFTPAGAAPRPLLVAAHGAGGDPTWDCEYWRRLTADRVFVLCLRGTPLGGLASGYFYRDHLALGRELAAAERAARALEPRILATSGVYAGFSQGASMGVPILHEHARAFPYVVLIEGFTPWNIPLARRFLRSGGQRALFICGSKQCGSVAKTSAHWLEVAGGQARLEMVEGAGHTPLGPVMKRAQGALPWLLAGDPNWQ
jgi:predicted esterase